MNTTLRCLLGAVFLVTASDARAQDFLNFSAPGARASGMGGAFIGVADDASTAVTNPAGLSNLTRPEVYGEFKNEDAENPELGRNSFVSFLSAAVPVSPRVTVAGIVHKYKHITGDENGFTFAGSVGARVGERTRVGVTAGVDRFREFDSAEYASKIIGGVQVELTSTVLLGIAASRVGDDFFVVGDVSRFGAGIAVTPTPRFLVAADIVSLLPSDDDLEQKNEFRAGAEYLLAVDSENRLFVRSGVCRCPNLFDSSEDRELSGSVGVGYALRQRFQTDFAFVSRGKEVTVSAAVRF